MVFGNSNSNNPKALDVVKEDFHDEEDGANSSQNRSYSSKNYTTSGGDDTDQESGGHISHAKSIEMDNDSKCMKTSRILILVSLLLTGVIAGGVTYHFTSQSEEAYFQDEANFYAYKIEEAIKHKSKNFQAVMNTMAVTVASHAQAAGNEWPFETFPYYESVASQFRNVSGTSVIVMAPLVEGVVEKAAWGPYSVEHQGWLEQSYVTMGWEAQPYPIQASIYDVSDNGVVYESKSQLTMPLWQRSEPPKDTGVVNYNLLSNVQVEMTFTAVSTTKHGQLGPVMDTSSVLGDDLVDQHTIDEVDHHPESLFIQPILELDETSTQPSMPKVVATLVASLPWDTLFSNLYHDAEGGEGMVLVVESSCPDQVVPIAFTYRVNGDEPVYLGAGDLHDVAYDNLVHFVDLGLDSDINVCQYSIAIYPSATVQKNSTTSEPVIFAVIMAMLFLAAAVFFLVYDYFVQRRQRDAMAEAARSNAIVSSLFPAEIRDRLLNSSNHETGNKKANSKMTSTGVSSKDMEKNTDAMGQKFRLKTYLDEEGEEVEKNKAAASKAGVILESKPIADLFPNTTVLFADIAGFTAWSSVREPSQVFTLLETVYKAFDKTAKRRKVFKVETVGDCYVAVTGLPEPVEDHAVIMCRFARECLTQFNQLASQLEVILGPDTGDLNVRVGIHSGPVTAGVLRGDKSRFQLFGDTVNTAARIESTGMRDRIHLSHETAELIHAAGKSNWMVRRTDTIVAKGKGEMQTYWLLTDEELAAGPSAEASKTKAAAPLPVVKALQPRLAKTTMDVLDPESSLPPKVKRLVDWNVDVLKRLLKQIVAKRNAEAKEKYDMNHPLMMKHEMNIGSDTYVLNEVSEIICLPGYSNVKLEGDPNKVVLPDGVEQQLRLYVSSIAAMHRDNPFHNFEHASHVMMSVSKLLSRIVAPDEVLHGDNEQDKIAASLHDHTYGITSDPLTQFSVVLAALIHDVDHSGVSNAQLIKEGAKIADVFKQKSVAEQNSIVLAWDRLMESRFTALRGCIYSDPEELKRFRQLMVNTVLATDIFDKELQTLRKNRWDTAFTKTEELSRKSTIDEDRNRKATIVLEHLIQASDVAHTMQHWHIYQKWNERLFAEMTHAYQHGRLGFNPAEAWYKGEIGFFDNYIIPLAKKLKECGVFGVSSDEYLNYAMENRREWAVKGEEVVKRMIAKYSAPKEEEASTPIAAPVATTPTEAAEGGKQERGGSIKA